MEPTQTCNRKEGVVIGDEGLQGMADNTLRILRYHGLLVEISQNVYAPKDLVATPSLRARMVELCAPRGAIACLLCAHWIYTGRWPANYLPHFSFAHPKSSRNPVVMRKNIPEYQLRYFADFPVTTPLKTLQDIAEQYPLDTVFSCALNLVYSKHLTAQEISIVASYLDSKRYSTARKGLHSIARYLAST
ncbi:hypothetical protein [Actinotignum urinale]|uniref:hypothetical protein n=1 Tax=Actinotignum urinale TaxID=190146 RepID=UPI00370D56D8